MIRTPSRARRIAKWTGLVLCVVIPGWWGLMFLWFSRGWAVLLVPYVVFNLLFVVVLTIYFWCLDSRRPHCQHCGYNLTGNVSGRCPECGEAA